MVFAKFDLIRSHFVYADVIYDQSYKSSFHEKLELIQYNAALPATRAIRGSPSEKVYQELGLEEALVQKTSPILEKFKKQITSISF